MSSCRMTAFEGPSPVSLSELQRQSLEGVARTVQVHQLLVIHGGFFVGLVIVVVVVVEICISRGRLLQVLLIGLVDLANVITESAPDQRRDYKCLSRGAYSS